MSLSGLFSPARHRRRRGAHPVTRTLAAIGAASVVLYGSRVLLNFFGPNSPYDFCNNLDVPLDSPEFTRFLSIVTDGTVRPTRATRLKNGVEFYPAELEAIRSARRAINLEYYEFQPGEVGSQFLHALAERARAGVQVRLIVDRIGSFSTPSSFFHPLRAAGGQMHWYHPVRWNTWQNLNQRTHRKLLVVDGEVGFLGGAGIADHWLHATKSGPAWRDTVFRVEGKAVDGLLSTFSENWLECSGGILSGRTQFTFQHNDEGTPGFVVISTPRGGGTQARILFQSLISSARRSIRITTPYFLPDRSTRAALASAVRDRGVKVQILTAGRHIDHPLVRRLSLQSSLNVLRAGVEICDFEPSMIHAKLMTIDGQWCVFGSTNFDHRSFALNDEVNLAVLDPALAATLAADQDADFLQSTPLTVDNIRRRFYHDLPSALLHGLRETS